MRHFAGRLTDRGDPRAAEDLCRHVLAIVERLDPGSAEVALTLGNLRVIAMDRGDMGRPEELIRGALNLEERVIPGSLELAATCGNLGNVERAQGHIEAAEARRRRSLAIRGRLAPGSVAVAQSVYDIGARARGDGANRGVRLRGGTSTRIPHSWTDADGSSVSQVLPRDAVFTIDSVRSLVEMVWALRGRE